MTKNFYHLPFTIHHTPTRRRRVKGQSTLEFTFAMIAILFLLYGMIQVFRWVGIDMAQRQFEHRHTMGQGTSPDTQLNPSFYRPSRLNAFINADMIAHEENEKPLP